MKAARLFFAYEFTDEARERIWSLVRSLQLAPEVVRLVPVTHLHVTARFLGGTPIERISLMIRALEQAELPDDPCSLQFDRIRLLPTHKPRVIALGCGVHHALHRSVASLDRALANIAGLGSDGRPYAPHVTVARTRVALPDPELSRLRLWRVIQESRYRVERLTLFESILKPDHPVYNSLASRSII